MKARLRAAGVGSTTQTSIALGLVGVCLHLGSRTDAAIFSGLFHVSAFWFTILAIHLWMDGFREWQQERHQRHSSGNAPGAPPEPSN